MFSEERVSCRGEKKSERREEGNKSKRTSWEEMEENEKLSKRETRTVCQGSRKEFMKGYSNKRAKINK